MSKRTEAEIAAIRERANEMQRALSEYSEMTYLDTGFQTVSDVLDIARFRCAADVPALLEHTAALEAENARLRAAVREQKTVLGIFAGIAERYHEHVKTTPEPFEGWFMRVVDFPLLLDECEAAGEALAGAAREGEGG